MKKKIALLGSTGSIGIQTLQVIDMHSDKFEIISMVAGGNKEKLLEEQIIKYRPKLVSVNNKQCAKNLRDKFKGQTQIICGQEGAIEAASMGELDIVVAAISGAAGLMPTLSAIRAGKDVALANKETLVIAGSLVMKEVKEHGINFLPVDSEHSAIFQCFNFEQKNVVESIILTASGGPFRGYNTSKLQQVKLEDALKHPNWSMGNKITIDSATLMNKGLEVIEAHWLFQMPYESIEVIIHPQSVIHSMVRYKDGSILAHLGKPDMRVPIQFALTYPFRVKNSLQQLNFAQVGSLTFEEPDMEAFPCLKLAFEAGKRGGTLPAVLNAANEVAVDLFLKEKIRFTQIAILVEKALEKTSVIETPTLEEIIDTDSVTRELTKKEYTRGLVN